VEVDATDILAAKTKFELLELAELHGIVSVPDEWTIKKIKERRRQQRDKAIDSANSLAAKAENDASGQRQGLLGKGMSFFSRREATMRPDMEYIRYTVLLVSESRGLHCRLSQGERLKEARCV